MKLPIIKGRETIPVRLIPFITGWDVSPDQVANILAHKEKFDRFGELFAYHLQDGDPSRILPKEWDGILLSLEVLSDKLKSLETIDFENYPRWRLDSVPLLPPGVFVWRDDFEAAYKQARSPEYITYLDETPGIRELNYSPLLNLPATILLEGFDKLSTDKSAPVGGSLNPNAEASLLKLVITMAVVGYKYAPNSKRNEAVGEIVKDAESLGLKIDADTVRKWLRRGAELLPNEQND